MKSWIAMILWAPVIFIILVLQLFGRLMNARLFGVCLYILLWSVFLVAPVLILGSDVSTSTDWILFLCAILGASVAVALTGLLKFKQVFPARYHYPEISTPVTRPPSGLPAPAAAALLIDKGRAPIASLVEMCQRGTLHIEAVARSRQRTLEPEFWYTYRLSVRDRTRHPWEQTLCEALPRGAASSGVLNSVLDRCGSAMAEQLEEHLRTAGIFNHVSDPPIWPRIVKWFGRFGATVVAACWLTLIVGASNTGELTTVNLGVFLLSIGLFTYLLIIVPLARLIDRQEGDLYRNLIIGQIIAWVALAHLAIFILTPAGVDIWWIVSVISIVVCVYYLSTSYDADAIIESGVVTLTGSGIREIAYWRAFRKYLFTPRSHGDSRPPDSLLPYVVALTAGDRWLDHWADVPAWFEITGEVQPDERCRLRREAYREFMSAATKRANTSSSSALSYLILDSGDMDIDADIDLDLNF